MLFGQQFGFWAFFSFFFFWLPWHFLHTSLPNQPDICNKKIALKSNYSLISWPNVINILDSSLLFLGKRQTEFSLCVCSKQQITADYPDKYNTNQFSNLDKYVLHFWQISFAIKFVCLQQTTDHCQLSRQTQHKSFQRQEDLAKTS